MMNQATVNLDSFIDSLSDEALQEIKDAVDDGATTVTELLGLVDGDMNALEQIAINYMRAGHHKQAMTILLFLLQLDSKRPTVWRALGATFYGMKDYLKAALMYQGALRVDPHDKISRFLCGEALCLTDKRDIGLYMLKHVLELSEGREDLTIYRIRARSILEALGDPERVIPCDIHEATDAQKIAIGVEPDHDLIDFKSEMLARMPPLTPEALKDYPDIQQYIDKTTKAVFSGERPLGEVAGFTIEELDVIYKAAVVSAEVGNTKSALYLLSFLVLMDALNPRYYHLAGVVAQRINDYNQACMYFRAALRRDENAGETRVLYGECRIMQGEVDAGIEEIRIGLKNTHISDAVRNRGSAIITRYA